MSAGRVAIEQMLTVLALESRHMRFVTRSAIALGLLIATLALLVGTGWVISDAMQTRLAGAEPARRAEERVFTTSVIRVDPGSITPSLTAYGEVRARRSVELRSPGSGTVVRLADNFEDGRAVTAGQVLMELDPVPAATTRDLATSDLVRAEAEQAEATRALQLARDELTAAQAQATLRQQALTRQNDLLERGVGSESAVETAALAASSADQAVLSRRQALSQAETQVALTATAMARQRITLAEAERALADTVLRAEFAGVLSGISLSAGGRLSAGERIGDLIDPTALELSFRVSTTQFGQLVDGQGNLLPLPITAELEAGNAALSATGRLSRVGAAVGDGQTGRLIHAELDGAPAFRPGDFVLVSVQEPALENAAILPGAALGATGQAVLVVAQDDRLREQEVKVLRRQGDDVIIEAAGLDGQDVVADWSPLLGSGIKVRVAGAPDDTASLVPVTAERRAALIAAVEADSTLAEADRDRLLDQLAQDQVPDSLLRRLEERAGG